MLGAECIECLAHLFIGSDTTSHDQRRLGDFGKGFLEPLQTTADAILQCARNGMLEGSGDVGDVLPAHRYDHIAAARLQLHHALAAQRQQRLAHRRDADPELGRGLVEPDECSGAQRARHDRLAEVLRHLVGQLRTAASPGPHGPCGSRCVHVTSEDLCGRRQRNSVTQATPDLIKYNDALVFRGRVHTSFMR